MILQSAIELFVERIEPAAEVGLQLTRRVIVVDACRGRTRAALLVGELEQLPGVSAELRDGIGALTDLALRAGETVWILIDHEGDLAYCELLREDLCAGGRAGVELIAVGELPGASFAERLSRAQVGGGPRFRRRRDIASGAAAAARLLEPGGAGT